MGIIIADCFYFLVGLKNLKVELSSIVWGLNFNSLNWFHNNLIYEIRIIDKYSHEVIEASLTCEEGRNRLKLIDWLITRDMMCLELFTFSHIGEYLYD